MSAVVSVVIVNFNSGGHLVDCLAAAALDLGSLEWQGVVVDNASTDGSEAAAESFHPRLALVRNGANRGFAAAVNQGLRATRGELVLLVNPDCHLVQGAVATLIAELNAQATCAIVGPRVLDADGSLQASARGDPDMLTGLFGRTTLFTRLFPRSQIANRNLVAERAVRSSANSVAVDWISGACMLARRSALEQVGGFDERYFLYWEDADLCRRLRARGYEIRYVPRAQAVHVAGASSRTAPLLAARAFHESAYTYYRTHLAPGRFSARRVVAWIILRARLAWKVRRASSRRVTH